MCSACIPPTAWRHDPVDVLFDRYCSSVEALHHVIETVEYGVRRSSRSEPFETAPLDVLDEWWDRALQSFDTAYPETTLQELVSYMIRYI